ncbi:penicillin-binding protein 2 [Longimicrobium sp.]|uniref:penicillin-binding protein 2 n=1 Tax=Longimicrobium sp. TaxID=2029185 RepID=UPI002CB60451|nr:penicillin-binding protein 2 [Longimicrobium sp.]HSU13316.1 penicillin-binding protein 2 [Longimicrobium sp.]
MATLIDRSLSTRNGSLSTYNRSLSTYNPYHPHARRRRAFQAGFGILMMLGLLGAAFFRTQIVRNDEFVLRSDDNRFRIQPIPAPRGAILDRNGKVIAETVTGYSLTTDPGPPEQLRARLRQVAGVVGLDDARIQELVEWGMRHRDEPVQVSHNLSFAQVSWFAERSGRLTGLHVDPYPIRHYPAGAAVGHVVGYVSEISDRELESEDWRGYRSGQNIGKTGLEREYERMLGGRAGARYVEVDARGKLVRGLTRRLSEDPAAGENVRLTLDLDLQRYIHQVWPADRRGAVVAMVPSTGEILALYSAPTYDPNLLVGSIPRAVWQQLNTDPGKPLLNRATHGTYPPGSTWKLATALIGLERGVITPTQVMPIACTGGMSYAGRYSHCWKREGHGPQNLLQAIQNSCNVYFYQLGIMLGLDVLTREGTRLGFGRKTGVDLPSEKAGNFPTGREWYVRRFGWRPPPSEVMNVAIGQGPNDETPLRMAQFFSALAGNGTSRTPHLLMKPLNTIPVETDLHVAPTTLAAVHEGLARVIEEGGTAHAVELRNWQLSGKTGTSQNSADPARPHGWFTGFAGPRGKPPEIVVAVIVEFGEHGASSAAPIASEAANFYLNKIHGRPTPALLAPESARVGAMMGAPPPPPPSINPGTVGSMRN